ncbi:putative Secreted alkaline phosphatase [Streptomyces misionensis JCM 4497]
MDPGDPRAGGDPRLGRRPGHRGRLGRRQGQGPHPGRRQRIHHRDGRLRPHREGRHPRPGTGHRLLVPLLQRRHRLPGGPHPHRPGRDRRRRGAPLRRGHLRQLGGRLLLRIPPPRRPWRPGRLAAPRRLHLRVPVRRVRGPQQGRTPARPRQRDHHARRLPHPARQVQDRPRPAGPAPDGTGHRHLGRPRVRRQRLVGRRGQPHRGRRGHLDRPQGGRQAGVLRVDAGAPGDRGHHLPAAPLRQARRPVPAGPALVPLPAGVRHQRFGRRRRPHHHRPGPAGLAEGGPEVLRHHMAAGRQLGDDRSVRRRLAHRRPAGAARPAARPAAGRHRRQHRPVGRLHPRPPRAARPPDLEQHRQHRLPDRRHPHVLGQRRAGGRGHLPSVAVGRHRVRHHLDDLRQPRRHRQGARGHGLRGRRAAHRGRQPARPLGGHRPPRLRRARHHRRPRPDGLLRPVRPHRPERHRRLAALVPHPQRHPEGRADLRPGVAGRYADVRPSRKPSATRQVASAASAS